MLVANLDKTLYSFLTSLLRLFPPETAHNLTIQALKLRISNLLPRLNIPENAGVILKNSKLHLPNRIGLAAGFDKNAEVFDVMLRLGFGFVECGTVTPKPQTGNPSPRVFRLQHDSGVINRLGFNNRGVDYFVKQFSTREKCKSIVGANVGANKASVEAGNADRDYVFGVKAVWNYVDYITLNISSPNTPGLRNLQYVDILKKLLDEIEEVAESLSQDLGFRPIFLKVAPDIDKQNIKQIAKIAVDAPCLHGLIVSNTTITRPESLYDRNRNEVGGLSGKPLMELSTHTLRLFANEVADELDLIGVGGITSPDDVQAKLHAGAQAVQVYTGLTFNGLKLIADLVKTVYTN